MSTYKKISELSESGQIVGTELVELVQGGASVRSTVSAISISSSYALSASWAPDVTVTVNSSSWSSASISSSYAPIELFLSSSIVSQLSNKQPNLITGNNYIITSSWANDSISSSYASSSVSSSYSKTSSYALNSIPTISASWASASISSSYSKTSSYALNATPTLSSSWASSSISSSYAPGSPSISASYSLSSSYAPGSPSISASYSDFALQSLSSSYAPGSPSISASYSLSSSYSLNNGTGTGTIDLIQIQVFL